MSRGVRNKIEEGKQNERTSKTSARTCININTCLVRGVIIRIFVSSDSSDVSTSVLLIIDKQLSIFLFTTVPIPFSSEIKQSLESRVICLLKFIAGRHSYVLVDTSTVSMSSRHSRNASSVIFAHPSKLFCSATIAISPKSISRMLAYRRSTGNISVKCYHFLRTSSHSLSSELASSPLSMLSVTFAIDSVAAWTSRVLLCKSTLKTRPISSGCGGEFRRQSAPSCSSLYRMDCSLQCSESRSTCVSWITCSI